MGLMKKLAGDAILYGLPSIVGRMLNWLLVFLHTRVFTEQADLAENAQLYTWLIPLQIIFTFGLETTLLRFTSKTHDKKAFDQILSFGGVWAGALCILIFIFSKNIAVFLDFPSAAHLVSMLAIILWVDTITAIGFVKLRAENKAARFASIRMTNIFINILLNLFYLVFCPAVLKGTVLPEWASGISTVYDPSYGADYIIWANYIASALTLLLLWREFKDFKFRWKIPELKTVITYAYPLMFMGLAGSINLSADRLLLRDFLPRGFYEGLSTDQAFSIYAQVYKLSIFMSLVIQAYRYAADPIFFSKIGDKNNPKMLAFSTHWFTLACIVLWLGVSLNLDWIQLLIGSSYRMGIYIVPILLLANLFVGLYGNISIWFKLTDKTYYGTYITLAAMLLTLVLNLIFIPKYGFLACAITFTLSSFLMVLLAYLGGQKYYKVPYATKITLFYLLLSGIVIYIFYSRQAEHLWQTILIKNAVFLLIVGLIALIELKYRKGSIRKF
jgi:O-antigen/teichoic acid export membrane protein